jgi:hypothetical protein
VKPHISVKNLKKSHLMKPCQSNINQSTQKRGNTRNKREGPTSKKTKESPKRANHKGNFKFPTPLQSCFVCEYYYISVHAKGDFICLSQEGSLPLFTVFNTMQQCCLLGMGPTLFVEQQSALFPTRSAFCCGVHKNNCISCKIWLFNFLVLGFIPFEAH